MNLRRCLATSAVVLADLTALLTLAPEPAALARELTSPHAWLAEVGADSAASTLAGAALWCVAVWLGLGLGAALAIQLPGCVGRTADAAARVLLPRALYRVVAGALGFGILLAPVAASARGGPVAQTGAGPAATSVSPTTPPTPPPTLPAPTWPGEPPTSGPAPAAPTVHDGAKPTGRPADGVIVRPGDSLWRIAAVHLGERASAAGIAAAWPQWYAANRTVIGADPNLIEPGQHLQAPATDPAQP
jgi:resuscitation-promoting factor RpfA